MKEICAFKLDSKAILPKRNYSNDAGLDIYALENTFIPLGSTVNVKTGIALDIHPGFVGKLENRSGMALKGLSVTGGIIDAGYNGEISVVINNLTYKDQHDFFGKAGYLVEAGDRISQLLLYPVELPKVIEITKLWNSERGNKGFNSSGR